MKQASNRGRLINRRFLAGLVILVITSVVGCGDSDIGRVSGTVRLDGKPLPDATVEFQPEDGSPSYGLTDRRGRYELMYLPKMPGAEVGQHTVRVTTYDWVTNEDGSKSELPELVPPRYNVKSQLRYEVKSGTQTFDIEIESGDAPPEASSE